MKVVLTESAEVDLEAIADFIARDSPERALSFVVELRLACRTLEDAPLGHVLVPRYERTGVRRKPFGNYLIFYRVAGEIIEVIHILHGARDFELLLFPEE